MVEIHIDQAVSQNFDLKIEAVPGASDPAHWLPWGGKDGALPFVVRIYLPVFGRFEMENHDERVDWGIWVGKKRQALFRQRQVTVVFLISIPISWVIFPWGLLPCDTFTPSYLAANCLAARQTRLNRTLSEGKSRVRHHSATGGDSVDLVVVTLYFVSANGT